jgi:hypothetical protein
MVEALQVSPSSATYSATVCSMAGIDCRPRASQKAVNPAQSERYARWVFSDREFLTSSSTRAEIVAAASMLAEVAEIMLIGLLPITFTYRK